MPSLCPLPPGLSLEAQAHPGCPHPDLIVSLVELRSEPPCMLRGDPVQPVTS